MKTNVQRTPMAHTHEGAPSPINSPAAELRRSVMSCMLFEGQFYEGGEDHAVRLAKLLKKVTFEEGAAIAIEAREKMKLRHVPLFLTRELLRNHDGRKVGDLVFQVIQRPDEIGELLALYWKENPKAPLKTQLKIGIARALKKFNEYQLAKWDSKDGIRLRDAMFLSHARPRTHSDDLTPITKGLRKSWLKDLGTTLLVGMTNDEQLWYKIAQDMLETPDTWETNLSAGANKKEVFTRLIQEKKLGAMALLRNLRGMLEVRVDEDIIRSGLANMSAERVLPFRFISAARHAPRLEDAIEEAMFKCLAEIPKLGGKTALLIDHSGSMQQPVSSKSEISRFDAAGALALILRQVCSRCRVFTFSDRCIEVPPRIGFGLLKAVQDVINPVGTLLGKAVRHVYNVFPECDRLIVVTDEQSTDRPPHPQGRGYIVNVGDYRQGIAYGPWVTINGWSEAIVEYIRAYESSEA